MRLLLLQASPLPAVKVLVLALRALPPLSREECLFGELHLQRRDRLGKPEEAAKSGEKLEAVQNVAAQKP